MKRASLLAIILVLLTVSSAWAMETGGKEPNVSCAATRDCVVKNVGNCCGQYPMCVNRKAEVDPEAVRQECAKNDLVGVCGFPVIDHCECQKGVCVGVPPMVN